MLPTILLYNRMYKALYSQQCYIIIIIIIIMKNCVKRIQSLVIILEAKPYYTIVIAYRVLYARLKRLFHSVYEIFIQLLFIIIIILYIA